jgi:hypothetical protein
MVLDQFVVDRGFGGRFTPKDSWRYLAKPGGNFKVWDVIQDNYPDNTDQKVFKPGTAAAANPVCISCKTQDHILDWAYMGDPVPGAKWSRSSKVVEFVKSVNHANNCIFCHDPHAAKPRVVRDALIQASAQGVEVALVTGRSFHFTGAVVDLLFRGVEHAERLVHREQLAVHVGPRVDEATHLRRGELGLVSALVPAEQLVEEGCRLIERVQQSGQWQQQRCRRQLPVELGADQLCQIFAGAESMRFTVFSPSGTPVVDSSDALPPEAALDVHPLQRNFGVGIAVSLRAFPHGCSVTRRRTTSPSAFAV